ncbi:hypothetical protein Ccrd_021707, partial [Cynara cardunculus var. scolymus]
RTISESFKSAPTFSKPFFSSSNVIWPLPSASIILNISLSPAISSSDRIASVGKEQQNQEAYLEPHHQPEPKGAVSLLLGSRTSILLTKSFALSDMLGHGSDAKSRSPFNTCSNIPCSVSDSDHNSTTKK